MWQGKIELFAELAVIDIEQFISQGSGLYTVAEAARYARMHPSTLSRWLQGNNYGQRVFATTEDNSKFIGFHDFIQILAVRNLRVHYGIPLQTIREAVETASTEFGQNYPFARKHKTFLFDKQIWIKLEETKELVQISGKSHGQKGMTQVIEPFLKDIYFDPTSGLASRYDAFTRNNLKIVMNPRLRFGEPMLEGCGYTPEALFEAAKTEGSAEAAAKIYGVSTQAVEVCIEYFDYLKAA